NANERPIAVAIPCYNEAGAILDVLGRWRLALPDAEIVVFDNNSSDHTAALARSLGVRVVPVPSQGKGFAVQAMFAELRDRRAVVLTDGDGTYPPEEVSRLLEPVLEGQAEMTVGARQPVAAVGAMSPVRRLGNLLIRSAFRLLIGRGPGDLLSGYRVFSHRFLQQVRPHSSGFEIETELTGEAVAQGLRTVEIPIPYHPRAAGTSSKLRAVRDGLRILGMILSLAWRLRPFRLLTLSGAGFLFLALLIWSVLTL
ncbi:MAG TPA: glycosyltransferase, partial [Isosphaeraceae bacterium]|nr:glycosyltransferase [Isosphaeraceae bacterium]